jgi:hypothetical protein
MITNGFSLLGQLNIHRHDETHNHSHPYIMTIIGYRNSRSRRTPTSNNVRIHVSVKYCEHVHSYNVSINSTILELLDLVYNTFNKIYGTLYDINGLATDPTTYVEHVKTLLTFKASEILVNGLIFPQRHSSLVNVYEALLPPLNIGHILVDDVYMEHNDTRAINIALTLQLQCLNENGKASERLIPRLFDKMRYDSYSSTVKTICNNLASYECFREPTLLYIKYNLGCIASCASEHQIYVSKDNSKNLEFITGNTNFRTICRSIHPSVTEMLNIIQCLRETNMDAHIVDEIIDRLSTLGILSETRPKSLTGASVYDEWMEE